MVFTEEQLDLSPLSLLDQIVYLEQGESACQAITIPICENQRLNTHTIHVEDILRFSEQNDVDYSDSIAIIAESHNLEPSDITVVINEADIVTEPELVQEFNSVVVAPISEYDPIYQLCEIAVDAYADTEDDALFDFIINEIGGMMGGSHNQTMLAHIASDAGKLHRNPVKAYDAVKNLGPMPTRWGWDQNSLTRNIAFFKHPVVQAILGHRGSGGLERYKSAITSFAKAAGSTPESARKNAIKMLMNGINRGMAAGGLDPLEGRYPNAGSSTIMNKVISWGDKLGNVIYKYHPDNPGGSSSQGNHTLRNLAIAGAGAAGIAGILKGIQVYRNKPKSIIGRKIASLRKVYQKYLEQARKYPEKAGVFKKIASKILGAIDQLLGFLQRKAG